MRKHGKIIMAVFTVGLMLAWGIQGIVGRGGDSSGTMVRGTLDGRKIVGSDLYEAATDLKILSEIGIVQQNAWGQDRFVTLLDILVGGAVALTREEEDRPLHWFLLRKEAQAYGLVPPLGEATEMIAQVRKLDERMPPQLHLEWQMQRLGVSEKRLRYAIAHALQLRAVAMLGVNAVVPSLPRVELDADRLLSTADVTVAMIDGSKGWEKMAEPTEEQIKAQFELYKDYLAGGGGEVAGRHFPFGYKYPDRVKVEYLRFDRVEVAKQFSPTAEDEEAAFKYYTDHKKDDPRFVAQASALEVQGPNQAAAGGATEYKKWDEVKVELIQDEVARRVDKLLKKIVDRARTLTEEPWKNVDTENGYKKVLPREEWGDYQKIADEIVRNKEFGGFRPAYHAVTGFQSEAELEKLAGIGGAYYEAQHRRRPFAVMAAHVKELVGPKDPMADLFLMVGPEGQTLRDEAGNYYIYRVTAAEPSHVPPDLAEVRDQVVADLKKVAAYEQAKAKAKELAEKAKTGNLLELAKADGLEVEQTADVAHENQRMRGMGIGPKIGYVPGMVDAIFELAATPVVVEEDRGNLTVMLAKDETFKAYVIGLDRYKPVSPLTFALRRGEVVQQSEYQDRLEFVYSWTSLPSVMERMGFVPVAKRSGKEEE